MKLHEGAKAFPVHPANNLLNQQAQAIQVPEEVSSTFDADPPKLGRRTKTASAAPRAESFTDVGEVLKSMGIEI